MTTNDDFLIIKRSSFGAQQMSLDTTESDNSVFLLIAISKEVCSCPGYYVKKDVNICIATSPSNPFCQCNFSMLPVF